MRPNYDLSDQATRFFYEIFELMFQTYSQTFDEVKLNIFASQDANRLKEYKKYKGWKTISTWMEITDIDDFKSYYDIVKKYSILREFDKNGFPATKVMNSKNFERLTTQDVSRIIRSKAEKIDTTINAIDDGVVLNDGISSKVENMLITPEMGLKMPWDLLNEMFRGCRLGKVVFNGFLSNEGKTRNLMLLAAYITLVLNEKFLLLSNEMDENDLQNCLITTVINNDFFKQYHGVDINKEEKEIVLGIYRDNDGKIIKRKKDNLGKFIETKKEYINRVKLSSHEYRKVIQISEWIENKKQGLLFFKDVGNNYSDTALEQEIRRFKITQGVNYCGYDTLKGYRNDDWQIVKQTGTKIKELMKSLNMFCWAVFQLTDDSVYTDVFQLSSNNIANAKQIKHIADMLILGKRIYPDDYYKYRYICINDWGEPFKHELDITKKYFALKVDKNRGGDKDILPLYEINLDLNIWKEVGYLIKNERAKS